MKLIECEKRGKYLDLARELEKLWNMKATIIPIMIGAFSTVTKELLKGLEDLEVEGRVETIKTTELLRTTNILRSVLETWGDLLSLKIQWKTISWHRWENSQRVMIIIRIYIYIYIYIYINMKVNMDLNPTAWRKSKNRIIQIRWIYFDVKSTLKVSVLITFIRTLISWELFTQWWMLVEITGANKMSIMKKI